MRKVYLLLATFLLLCLAPMPYGYFQLVRFLPMLAFGMMVYQYNIRQKMGNVLFLFPQWFVLPTSRKAHSRWVDDWVLHEQILDVLDEGVLRMDGIEPIGDVAQVGIELVAIDLFVRNPLIGQMVRKVWLDYDVDIPKACVVGADITDNSNATQPVSHVLKLGYHKTTADSLFCSTIIHVGIEFGKRTKRGNLQCFPYRWHRRCVVLLEVFQNELVFRTIKFFLQTAEITLKHRITVDQCSVRKPECPMPLGKQTNHSGTDSYLYLLNGRKNEQTQFFVKVIKTDDVRKMGARLKDVQPLISLHQAPISCQSEITDRIKGGNGLRLVFDDKTSLLQNINLLLQRKQLLGISHKRIKNGPPWYAAFLADEKRWRDLLGAKVQHLFETTKRF